MPKITPPICSELFLEDDMMLMMMMSGMMGNKAGADSGMMNMLLPMMMNGDR